MFKYFRFILILSTLLLMIFLFSFRGSQHHLLQIQYPKTWPKPRYNFKLHPISEEGFQLGRRLFYDPILSRDSTISCASCHLQATGFTHVDHALSHGIEGKIGTRNSPALMNLAWGKSFMWDGGVNHIDVQALAPITNPLEMDETMKHVVAKLNASAFYRSQFKHVFEDSLITGQHLLLAISQFILCLNSSNSTYDKVMRHEEGVSFTSQEANGLKLFRNHCSSCHSEPLFTTGNFENNGLPIDTALHDIGRMRISGRASDSLKFKVPTLRNIQFTQPYMHDGRFKKLSEVMKFYASGIQASKTLAHQLKSGIKLDANEQIDIIAFLYTLTDKDFLFDPRYSYPLKN